MSLFWCVINFNSFVCALWCFLCFVILFFKASKVLQNKVLSSLNTHHKRNLICFTNFFFLVKAYLSLLHFVFVASFHARLLNSQDVKLLNLDTFLQKSIGWFLFIVKQRFLQIVYFALSQSNLCK